MRYIVIKKERGSSIKDEIAVFKSQRLAEICRELYNREKLRGYHPDAYFYIERDNGIKRERI